MGVTSNVLAKAVVKLKIPSVKRKKNIFLNSCLQFRNLKKHALIQKLQGVSDPVNSPAYIVEDQLEDQEQIIECDPICTLLL